MFEDRKSKEIRLFPNELHRIARRKILFIHDACELNDLRSPPGNKLESLKGNLIGFYSIRTNSQWKIVFKWNNGNAYNLKVVDYH